MPKNRKTPDLADWQVCFTDPSREPLTVRAVTLHRSGGDYVLDDGTGYPLFSAPRECVLYVRHQEPGLNVQAKEAAEGVKGPDPAGAAAETVATPAQRRRRSGAHS